MKRIINRIAKLAKQVIKTINRLAAPVTAAAVLCVATDAKAAFLFGGISLTTLTTAQSNSPTFFTNNGYVSAPQITVTNANLSATNSYIGVFRFSIDGGSTWFTNNSPVFTPTNTTGQTYVIQAQSFILPVQMQLLAITNVANTGPISLNATSP